MISSSFAFFRSGVGSIMATIASFSHTLGTLMNTVGRTSGSLTPTFFGSQRYVVKPSVLPRHASPKPKMWLIGSQSRSTSLVFVE